MSSRFVRRLAIVAALATAVALLVVPGSASAGGYHMSLTVDNTDVWPTENVTLTATTNANITDSGYYILIYETTGAERLISWCFFGSTCSLSFTEATPGLVTYRAYLASGPTNNNPPDGIDAVSNLVQVLWEGAPVTLTASSPTAAPGQSVTLTARTPVPNNPVPGPSPFFLEIYDATTRIPLSICSDERCDATVTQSAAATHRYVAYTTAYSLTFPPATIQTMSASSWVTWSASGWSVGLAKDRWGDVYAETNQDVNPTPYWIDIYVQHDNADGTAVTGTLVASCWKGTTCTVDHTMLPSQTTLVAFVSGFPESFPPTGIQAVNTYPYDVNRHG